MGDRGTGSALRVTAVRQRHALFPFYLVLLLLLPSHSAQAPKIERPPTTGPEMLAEARRLAFLHNWPKAAPLFAEAEKHFAASGDHLQEIYAHVGRLRGEVESLSLPEVSNELADILHSANAQSDPQLRLFCLVAKGDIDFQIDPKSSEAVWNEVARLAHSLGNGAWENRARAELGTIAFYKGEVYRAARMVVTAYSVAEMSHDVAYVIRLRAALGEGFAEFGHPQDALIFFENALDLAAKTPDAGYPFTAYLGKARALIALGRIAEGEAMLNSALTEARQNHLDVRTARTLFALGDLAQKRGDDIAARRCFQESSRLADGEHLRRLSATATARLAALSLDQDRSLTDAERLSRQSIRSTFAGDDTFHLPRLLATSAEVELKRGDLAQAERNYRMASDLVDRVLNNVTPFDQKDFLLASMSSIYLGQARLALMQHSPEKAFNALEHGYARGIAESLRSYSERDRLALDLTKDAARRVNRLQGLLFHESDRIRRSNILAEIWETEKRGVIIRDSDPIPFGADSQPVPLSQLQNILRPDELVLEYALDEPNSILLAIDQRSITPYRLPSQHELDEMVDDYLANINSAEKNVQTGKRLAVVLLGPVSSRRQKRFIVIAHGRLDALPFDALEMPDQHYLAETRVVTYSPSATILFELRAGRETHLRNRLLGVGAVPYTLAEAVPGAFYALNRGGDIGLSDGLFDPEHAPKFWHLPGSRRELAEVAAAIPGSTLLLDRAATEERIKSEPLDSYEVLHFSVHVSVDADHPDRTGLILADSPGSTEDGLLQAREIAHLRLHAKLVVLSGCNTGIPIIQSSFDNASLVRSFLFAGAKGVVATLWTIDDAFAAYLMGQFYGYLRLGQDDGTALEQAKRDAIRKYGRAGMPLWAGFRLVGNGYENIN